MTLTVNGTPITADENGVYHAYVGGTDDDVLTVSCQTENVTYKVTRMDTTGEIAQETGGTYKIPTFEGSLMLKIDGIVENNSATDVTSVFLLVSRDETPPVLTLSDPVFFADRDTGEYTVTARRTPAARSFTAERKRSMPTARAALPSPVRWIQTPASSPSARRTARATNPRSSWR